MAHPTASPWPAFDAAVLQWLALRRRPALTLLMRAATMAGDKLTLTAIGLGLWASQGPWTHLALPLGVGAAAGGVSAQAIKRLFRRPRPSATISDFLSIAGDPDVYSFPSGHTAASFGAAVAILGPAGVAGWVALAAAHLVGVSRMYLGAHYPSDVLAGVLLGSLVGAASNLWFF